MAEAERWEEGGGRRGGNGDGLNGRRGELGMGLGVRSRTVTPDRPSDHLPWRGWSLGRRCLVRVDAERQGVELVRVVVVWWCVGVLVWWK